MKKFNLFLGVIGVLLVVEIFLVYSVVVIFTTGEPPKISHMLWIVLVWVGLSALLLWVFKEPFRRISVGVFMKALFVFVSLVFSGMLGTALCLGLLSWCGYAAFSIVVLKQAVIYKQEAALALGAYLVLQAFYIAGKATGERKARGSYDFLFW